VLRETSAVRSDGFLRGGIGGVATRDVAACARRGCRRARPLRSHFQLHLCQVLRLQGAFASLRFQELLDGYSSRFGHTILHHYLYDSLFLAFLLAPCITSNNDDDDPLQWITRCASDVTF